MHVRKTFIFLFFSWLLLLIYLSLTPSLPSLSNHIYLGWDKLHHAGFYLILTLLLCKAGFCRTLCRFPVAAAGSGAISIGVILECLQHLMGAGRTFELRDIIANCVGAGVACFLCYYSSSSPATCQLEELC